MTKVYLIYIDAAPRTVPNKAVEYIFGENDWFRFEDGRSYFVATEEAPAGIYTKLKKVLHEEDMFTITAVQPGGFSGYFANSGWEWLNKYLSSTDL